jgi:hypothetical protein
MTYASIRALKKLIEVIGVTGYSINLIALKKWSDGRR